MPLSAFWTYSFYVTVIVGTLVIAVLLYGWMLPEKVPTVTHRITLPNQTCEHVWKVLNDVENEKSVDEVTGTRDVKRQSNGDVESWKDDLGSGNTTLSWKQYDVKRFSSLKREATDSVVPLTIQLEVRLNQQGDDVKLVAIEDTWIRNGTWHVPIFRVIMKFNAGYGSKQYLARIQQSVKKTK